MICNYYSIEPMVSFSIGSKSVVNRTPHPPIINSLHAIMEVWDGDSIIEAFPCFVFEDRLSETILRQKLTGIEFEDIEMTKSSEYAYSLPKGELPPFVRGIITGQKDVDDFYLGDDYILAISERALTIIKTFPHKYADITVLSE